MGLGGLSQEKVTEEEIRHLVTESHEQGVIDQDERNMLNRVLRLGERSADSLMTPRTRIAWVDAAAGLEENLATMRETPFSRYPVYRGSDTDVIGILEVKSLAGRVSTDTEDMLRELRPALFVSDSTNALKLLEIFREEQQPIALVVDEYGDIQGMVALNDLLGAVLGRAQATESIDGMVVAHYGRIPHAGEHFDWRGWRIEVVDLDGARVDKLLISRSVLASQAEDS
jgi:putative hemolysin